MHGENLKLENVCIVFPTISVWKVSHSRQTSARYYNRFT